MKLSEAILKGCEQTDPTIGALLAFTGSMNVPQTCALGAAIVAMRGLEFHASEYSLVLDLFPILNRDMRNMAPTLLAALKPKVMPCSIMSGIMMANDLEHMKREEIARLLAEDGL